MEDIILEENILAEELEAAEMDEAAENAAEEAAEAVPAAAIDPLGEILDAHIREMKLRFPDVDLKQLDHNSAFRRFVGSRYGKESLADLYEAYTDIVSGVEKAASYKSAAKAARTTGGSSGKSAGALSSDQREALRRWNESNPDMKMSEKEFLGRG